MAIMPARWARLIPNSDISARIPPSPSLSARRGRGSGRDPNRKRRFEQLLTRVKPRSSRALPHGPAGATA